MPNMIEHLTVEQMSERYPNTWLGISNMKYDTDGVTIISADVIYTDKDREELARLQVEKGENIIDWYTDNDGLPLGMLSFE